MYITLQSTKRNLGLFNLEVKDIILAGIFALAFIIFFSLGFYQTGLVFLFRNRTFYYHLETDEVRRDQYKKFTRTIQRTKAKK